MSNKKTKEQLDKLLKKAKKEVEEAYVKHNEFLEKIELEIKKLTHEQSDNNTLC